MVLVTNIPTPYRIPLFNEIHRQFLELGWEFRVVFAALGYARRKWAIDTADFAFPHEVLPPSRRLSLGREHALFTYPGLLASLKRENPTLVIVGGFSPATLKVFLKSFVGGPKYLIWSGAVRRSSESDRWLRRVQRAWLVRRASGFIAYGTQARDYLASLGADLSRTHIAINTVDTEFYRSTAEQWRATQPPSPVKRVLYVGNLEPGKRIDLLLRAAAQIAPRRDDFTIELVGDGSARAELEKLTATLGLSTRVHFHGFCQRKEVAQHLASAYCFAFPSEYDVWGLVVIEAMAAGLPCLASIRSGVTRDAVTDGETGFALDFEDTNKVASTLESLLDDPARRDRLGTAAIHAVTQRMSLPVSAGGFIAAVRQAHANPAASSDTEAHTSSPSAASTFSRR